ncbi:regulatory protein RecX [Carboxylicivirga sp. RSCT41]|uniref:regulatory protein RecX n=1 Tax=Carboxylicivirga agarovorans TaxID=3417570 RepID=UPI003D335C9F
MDYRQALNKAAALCSRKEYCTADIQKKLVNWDLTEEEVGKALEWLSGEKFIDDKRYAAYYVRDKFRFNGWGRIKIRYQLRGKQITSSVIDEALEQIDEGEYLKMLAELLHSKKRSVKNKDAWQKKAALARFAQSRGFEPDVVFSMIDEVLNDIT